MSALIVATALLVPSAAQAVPPPNDTYPPPASYPFTVASSSSGQFEDTRDVTDATTQGGENTTCTFNGNSYGIIRTVWYRFTPGVAGFISVTASGYDVAIKVYPNAANGVCYDGSDNVTESASGSVSAGTVYEIQVGDTNTIASVHQLVFSLVFLADRDLDGFFDDTSPLDKCLSTPGTLSGCPDADGDGFSPLLSPADCLDSDRSVHPGAAEVLNNELDDNCNGAKGYDRDHDGYAVGDPNSDCNDGSASVHPGAVDVPLNKIDDDCNNQPPKVPKVTAKVKLPYSFKNASRNKYIKATLLSVQHVTGGATVDVSCKRKGKRACKHQRKTGNFTGLRKVRLRVGTVIVVRVTKPGFVGRYFRFDVKPGSRSERDRCLDPGSTKPQSTCVKTGY